MLVKKQFYSLVISPKRHSASKLMHLSVLCVVPLQITNAMLSSVTILRNVLHLCIQTLSLPLLDRYLSTPDVCLRKKGHAVLAGLLGEDLLASAETQLNLYCSPAPRF